MNKRIHSRVAILVIAVILFPSLAFAPSFNRQVQITIQVVDADNSPKPGFTALRDYWRSLFASGEMITDASGEAVFSGMGGEYEIAVFADGYEQQTIRIHVDKSGGNTIQLVVQPQAIAAGEEVEEADDYGYFLFLFIIPVFVCGAVLFVVALWKKRRAK